MVILYLYAFCGEVSVFLLLTFYNSSYIPGKMQLMKYGICKYFGPLCDLLSHYFSTIFMRAQK